MATVIKCIVADKKVVDVLRMLKGVALEPPVAEPLDDIQTPQKSSKGTLSKKIYDLIEEKSKGKDKIITAAQLTALCKENGCHATAYSYALKKLIAEKLVRRGKLPHTYEVIK